MDMELEAYLRPPEMDMPPYPAKVITLATGGKLVVRQVDRDEIPDLLKYVEPLLHVERDYYDVVASRVYAELLGHYQYRFQDQYVLAVQIDGELADPFGDLAELAAHGAGGVEHEDRVEIGGGGRRRHQRGDHRDDEMKGDGAMGVVVHGRCPPASDDR